ncbi:MAG: inorganic pyrophosphatase [Chloroflexi bacterium]|nr:inorganic pyrophosphatase [Chloroflexota bacterium]
MDDRFWILVDQLVDTSEIVIDRPRGSAHPRRPEVVYPMDYGYLSGTGAVDGGGVDVWRGSLPGGRVTAAIVTVDVSKRDAEVKLLVGCTAAECRLALRTHNQESQAGLLVVRPHEPDADR